MAPRINIPPITRAILSAICALSFLNGVARWRQYEGSPGVPIPYLSLVPSNVLFYPWTLLTATCVELNIFTVIISGATVLYGGKYLERAWGSREFAKVILVVSLVPNIVMTFLYILWSSIVSDASIAQKGISGGIAIQAAFLVAFKQLVPEHTVTILKGIVKMRVKHFPALFLLLNAIGGIVLGTDVALNLSWLGLLSSWTYLRFYKRQPDLSGTSTNELGMKGDASETFAFANFFPDAIQPPISFVADKIYSILIALRVCTPFSEEDIASGNEQAIARGQAGLPNLLNNGRIGSGRGSGKREEAERRRALALKALDQRLQAAAPSRPVQPAAANSSPSQKMPPRQPSPLTAAPSVPPGQSMLGETNYTPDHS
ncbi:rhomboid family protein [Histoplasma capsulatum var. duboisii H88]|uniref:Rhomboid family protein n=2 Tax=Ajellomyces capsulatus TaxID=5037 RepID=F0U890_AJEC8|nr:rhomboid family protein [Histoplasma capsulatum H143]EGC42495.1 rhomboid family protein [Histoplasma capsulatum var. duboisii H88]QSS51089.1 rhomboid family protein [Histoplasma capsulatum var. duboisii H88]